MLAFRFSACATAALLTACAAGDLAEGWRQTPPGEGATVVWDVLAAPSPELPFPNDVVTYADPDSPTGLRLDLSLAAPSGFERRLRTDLGSLDGWSTSGPITVTFDAPLDTNAVLAAQDRFRMTESAFARHAVYLVDLETGVPVPLDVQSGRYPVGLADPDAYFLNDPRGSGSNLLFETVDELSASELGVYDPMFDTDYDGVLDVPNTFDGQLVGTPRETYDRLLTFYERQTNTLVLRPLLPLAPGRRYAVVLTDRLVGLDGFPVRSPFAAVHHAEQRDALAALPGRFAERPSLYGDLATRGWEGVAFAWAFTTQTTAEDLPALREGLYGRGPFADLADEFPPRLVPVPLRGRDGSPACAGGDNVHVVTPADLSVVLRALPTDDLGIPAAQLEAVLAGLEENVSHIAFGFFESPYLLGDPSRESPLDAWDVDRERGEASVERDLVPMLLIVPRETDTAQQPFATTVYAHGFGSLNLEALAFAAQTARHGVATVAVTAQGHGLGLDPALAQVLEGVLGVACLEPFGQALLNDRARDLDGDGADDPAGLFFSAYLFHTRDTLRQSALDVIAGLRVVRSFQGDARWTPGEVPLDGGGSLAFDGDVDGDGETDLAGDFDGDGTPDLGGGARPYGMWGSSLGGVLSMIVAGVEPAIAASAPVSGGAGLLDIGLRTELGGARNPVWLRLFGPILASEPAGDGPSASSACQPGERSVFFELPSLTDRVRTEITCLPPETLDTGDSVIVVNRDNGERRCVGVEAGGRFRVAMPADEGDRLQLFVYDGGREVQDYRTCLPPPRVRNLFLQSWESDCAECGRYQGRTFPPGERLVAPVEGLGLTRQTPALRRFLALAPAALDAADPINYARGVFLDPAAAEDVPQVPRSVLVLSTIGDTTVPIATGQTYARAAGVLAFLPSSAPSTFRDHRSPPRFGDRYPQLSPDDLLVDVFVTEGLSPLGRTPVPGATTFLLDPDDLANGAQFFAPDGRSQLAPEDGGIRTQRLVDPLRWARESRAAGSDGDDPWNGDTDHDGHSAILHAMVDPNGAHVLQPPDPRKLFDEGRYLLNVIGWFLASGGTELPWLVLDDPTCLEDETCRFGD